MMPINSMIPLAVGQGVPMVKTLGTVMADAAKMRAIDAQARRLDAISQQEAEEARQRQEQRARAEKADGIARLYANDEGQIGAKLREAGMLDESMAYDQFLAQHREKTAKAIQDGLESQKAVLAMTAPVLDQITDERSYGLATAMIEGYERLNPQAQGGLSQDLKRMSYQEAVQSGMLDKMRNFVKAQASNATAQQDAFKTFAAAMNTASDLDALYATVTSQQDLDGLNQSLAALRIPADLRNAYPTTYTPGMEATFQKRVEARQGAKAQTAAKAGSVEDYLTKYLPPNPTKEQYEKAVKDFSALNDQSPATTGDPFVLSAPPDESTRNTIIPGGTLTHGALYDQAENYLLTGENKFNPRAADPKERSNFTAIINAASARVQNGASIPQLRAEYAALNGGQKQQMKQYLLTSTFVNSALLGIRQAEEISKKYNPSDVPIVNDIGIWFGRNISGDPTLSELEVFVYNTARDYGKATSGSAGSVQQMTDAQIKASELLFSLRQSPAAFKAAMKSMEVDMGNIIKTQREKLNETREGILGLLDTSFGKPWLPEGAEAATTAKRTGKTGGTFTASTGDGRTVTFPSLAARDAAVKESSGLLTVAGTTPTTQVATGAKPPSGAKVGDKWQSPMGVLTFDGTLWR